MPNGMNARVRCGMGLVRSLSIAGLRYVAGAPWGGSPREAIAWAASLGYRAVQLDATAAGLRARELDRSGRREVAAILRRAGLALSGLDFMIPPGDFTDTTKADRAVGAATGALELAAELAGLLGAGARPCLSLELPREGTEAAAGGLSEACRRAGARIADHAWPARAASDVLGVGIDPATMMLAGADPAKEAARLEAVPLSARLSDLGPRGRVPPGRGRLDTVAYEVGLDVRGYAGALVVDLRGLREPALVAAEHAPASP